MILRPRREIKRLRGRMLCMDALLTCRYRDWIAARERVATHVVCDFLRAYGGGS